MPRCLGIYQSGDSQCDGEPSGKTEQERMPCVYRDRCVGFQKHLAKFGREPSFHLRFEAVNGHVYSFAKNQEKLDKLISKQISRWGIRNGRVTRRVVQPTIRKSSPPKLTPERLAKLRATKQPGRRALRIGGKVRAQQFAEARDVVTELAQWYALQLRERTGRVVAASQAAAGPGELFLIDRSELSGYVAVYAKRNGSKKQAITSLYYRPVSRTLEVRIALGFDEYTKLLDKATYKKLSPEDYTGKDGYFCVRIRGVDQEKASLIADTVAGAMKRRLFSER